MLFDSPQWQWARAYTERETAGLSNKVTVTRERATKGKTVLANVPLALFTLLRDVAKYSPQEHTATLYADQCEGKWFFGVSVVDRQKAERVYDLWLYDKLPAWLNPEVPSVPDR